MGEDRRRASTGGVAGHLRRAGHQDQPGVLSFCACCRADTGRLEVPKGLTVPVACLASQSLLICRGVCLRCGSLL